MEISRTHLEIQPREAAHLFLKQNLSLNRDVLSHEPTRWKPLQQRSSLSWNQDHRSLKPYLISLSIRNARYKWKAVSISISSVENMKRDGNDWQALHSSSVRHSREQKLSSLYGPSISWLRGRKFQKSMGLLYRCTQEMHTCAYVGGGGITEMDQNRGKQSESVSEPKPPVSAFIVLQKHH